MAACAEVLAASLDADNIVEHDARQRLRALLVDHLDNDLASEAVLLDAFRGRIPDE